MSKLSVQPSEFAEQMKALAHEAQRQMEEGDSRKGPPSFLQMLRPLVMGLEAVSRATAENTMVLSRLEAATSSHDLLPRVVAEIQEKFEGKSQINQQLFDALYRELKDYKDSFILEVLQKPLVRDLITLFDDLEAIQTQMETFQKALENMSEQGVPATRVCDHLKGVGANFQHALQFLLEVMARMEVTPIERSTGKLNKKTQRAVCVELAELESQDGDVVRSLKQGFMWRERIVRAEEVVIKKWKEGFLVALNEESKNETDSQSGTTDANLPVLEA